MKLSVTMPKNEVIRGWAFLLFQLVLLPTALVTFNQLLGNPMSTVTLNFTMFVISFLATVVIFREFLAASARVALQAPFRCLRAAFLGLVMYYAAMFLISLLIGWLMPGFSNANDSNIVQLLDKNHTLISIGTVFLVPITEEALHRGLLFRGLHAKSRVLAYAVSTLVFAALHVVNYIGHYEPAFLLLSFVQYLPAGLCLAWAYEQADSIWASILMHMTINQISISALR